MSQREISRKTGIARDTIRKYIHEYKNKIYIDETNITRARLLSEIITFLIKDVIETSKENITRFKSSNYTKFYRQNHRLNEKLITFSEKTSFIVKYLKQ